MTIVTKYESCEVCYNTFMDVIQECASRYGWIEIDVASTSDPQKLYTVTIPPWDWDRRESVCECPSYEFRGSCRHQHEALQRVCNWSQLDSEPQTYEQRRDHVCPECGGPTRVVEVENGD